MEKPRKYGMNRIPLLAVSAEEISAISIPGLSPSVIAA
jgi:hypothetical protein